MILSRVIQMSIRQKGGGVLTLQVAEAFAGSAVEIWTYLSSPRSIPWQTSRVINYFNEPIKDADIAATQSIREKLRPLNSTVSVVTEEDVDITHKNTPYALFVDPLDGSGHLRYQNVCGTFMTLVLLESGRQAISGYIIYGYKLTLVIAIDKSLLISVYDTDKQQFILTNSSHTMPQQGTTYSACDSDIEEFPDNIRYYLHLLRAQRYKSRYSGVLVADLHRIIIEGGIFLSPMLSSGRTKAKKYFEIICLAHIMRAAKGSMAYAYLINKSVLRLDQRLELFSSAPLIFGSEVDIAKLKETKKTW